MAVSPESNGGQDGILGGAADAAGGLADRGIGFQAAGFAAVWAVSTTLLRVFDGSDFWLYQWFETAVTGTYWAAVAPLAALFDWVRKMFERGKAIREAKKAEIWRKVRAEGRAEGEAMGEARGEARGRAMVRAEVQKEAIERVKVVLESRGITLSPEEAEAIFGDGAKNGS